MIVNVNIFKVAVLITEAAVDGIEVDKSTRIGLVGNTVMAKGHDFSTYSANPFNLQYVNLKNNT